MGLKSLSEIRGSNTDSPSSSGGLVPLSTIRGNKNEKRMEADAAEQYQVGQQSPFIPYDSPDTMDTRFRQESNDAETLKQQALQDTDSAFRIEKRQTLPGRDLPVVGPILKGLDAFSENPYVDTGASILRSFYTPGAGVANVGGLSNAVDTGISKLLPGLSSNLVGRTAQGLARESIVGAPIGAGQVLTQGGQLDDAAQGALYGAAFGGALGAAGPIAGKGLQALGERYTGTKGGDYINQLFDRSNPTIEPLPDYSNIKLSDGVGSKNPSMPSYKDIILNADSAQPEPFISKTLPPLTDNYVKPLSHYADTMYRETSPQNALDLIPGINSFSDMKGDLVYFANNKDLALGQGTNKGVMIEVDPNKIQGQVDRSKPNWETVYNNGDAEFIAKNNSQNAYKDAVKSVTIQPNATMDKVTKIQLNRALSNWDKVNNPDGSVSYLRPKDTILNSDTKDLIQLTPAEIARNDRIAQFSRVEDNPIIPNTADQIQSKTGRESIPLLQRTNEAYIKGVDNLHRIDQFDQAVSKVTGDLNPSESSYKLGLNSRGSDMITRQILEKKMVDSQGNVIGQSLKDIASQIPKDQYKQFEDYLVAKHSASRMGRGEKVYADDLNMTIQKAEAKAAEYEKSNPEFKQIAQQYYDYNKQLGQKWLVDTGILSQKQWDGYLTANPHYVPNQRIFSDMEMQKKFGSKQGFANQSNPVKKAEGSQRAIVSPFESTIENTAKYVKTAKQNEVMQVLYNNLKKDPEAFNGWAEIVNEPKSDVGQILHEQGPEGLLEEIAKSFEPQKPDLTKGNIVSVLSNGDRVHLRINDPQLLEALTNLNPQALPKWLEVIGKVTKIMKVLTTGFNPVFSLTRNMWRDIPHSFVSSQTNNTITFGKDLIGAFVDVMGNREAYQSYKNIGGGHSSSVAADRNLLAQSKEKILPSQGLGQTLKRSLITKPFHAVENFNNAIETAPRLAEYNRLAKEGDYNSKIEGLYRANDLTVNFNKYGTTTKQLDNLFPYLNASVQGLDQFGRMFKNNPVAASTKAFVAITIPTALLYAVNHNDPNYQQMSNFVKDNNFLIPNGDGTFTKVPKPRELGMVFSSSIERVMRAWLDHDPKAFQDFAANVIKNFSPPGVGGAAQGFQDKGITGIPGGIAQDTIAGPFMSLETNKDFAGRPIVPKDLQGLSPRLQFDSKTSEVAKKIGDTLNLSPKQLDYLAKSYGGVVSQLGIPLTTKGGSVADTLKQQVTADPVYSNDISKNFYDAKTKADMAKADAKHTQSVPENLGLTKFLDRMSTNISKFRMMMKQVQNDSSLSKEDKQSRLKELQVQINTMEQQATQLIK